MNFDCQKDSIKAVVELVERHTRKLQKKADLED